MTARQEEPFHEVQTLVVVVEVQILVAVEVQTLVVVEVQTLEERDQ